MNREHVMATLSSLEWWVLVEAGLGLFATVSVFSYNFPLFLFGLYALLNAETSKPLQVFTFFVFLSMIVDITTMALYSNNLQLMPSYYKFSLAMTIIAIIFKPAVLALSMQMLQNRGVPLPFRLPDSYTGGGYAPPANDIAYQPISNPAPYSPASTMQQQQPQQFAPPMMGDMPAKVPLDASEHTYQSM